MSRRTIGISINKMEYDEKFYRFLEILFKYQYTIHKIELNGEIGRVLYKLTNGSPSMTASLFFETQKNVILNGQEKLDIKAFETTFKDNFSTMIPYTKTTTDDKTCKRKRESYTLPSTPVDNVNENLFVNILKLSNKNISTAISMIKEYIDVEFISI